MSSEFNDLLEQALPRLCTNCSHYTQSYGPRGGDCSHPSNIRVSLVDGSTRLKSSAMELRCYMSRCGPDGKLFSPKPPKKKFSWSLKGICVNIITLGARY